MKITVGRRNSPVLVDEDVVKSAEAEGYYFCNTDRGYIILKKYLGWKNGRSKYHEVYLHRYIMKPPKGFQVDHINRDTLDNRRENLRICSPSQNSCNTRKRHGKYKGVHFSTRTNKWVAQITKNRKCHHIGSFESEEDAARAYNRKATELNGCFAYLNQVKEVASCPQ
jgi:hypothetical protein